MRTKQIFVAGLFLFELCQAWGQGTFVYDQQSATLSSQLEGGDSSIKDAQPMGQSFTPNLSVVGFVQFFLYDSSPNNNLGATIYIDIRANSITGPVLGMSDPIPFSPGYDDFPNFFFSTPVSVTPGTTYYFQPILVSGNMGIGGEFESDYLGGSEYNQGSIFGGRDLWFREGVIVPEPSTWVLLILGGALAGYKNKTNSHY